MSEEQTKQTVADEPDAAAEPAVEGVDAQDEPSLDDVLAEFNTATAPQADQQPVAATPDTPSDATTSLQNEVTSIRNQLLAQELTGAVARIKGDLSVSDELAEGFLHAQARKNPKLEEIFANKANDPAAWAKVESKIAKDFAKTMSQAQIPDQNATEDKDAVTAAMTGTSNVAPEKQAPNYSGLSDNEFRANVEKDYGFTPL